MKFCKKPVVIEAEQYQRGRTLSSDMMPPPDTFKYTEEGTLLIRTLEGTMEARDGDWVIRGIKGEFYSCKPDIFEATYEAVQPLPSDSGYFCDQCPHAMNLHYSDGSCLCGINCAVRRAAQKGATRDE